MTADPTSDRAAHAQLVVDVDRSGDMDPAEADRVLRECLSLIDKRLAAAIRPALADLQAAMPQDQNVAVPVPTTSELERDMADAVRSKRELFVPCFRAEFEQAFQRRRGGKLRTRGQRDESVALAMVDHGAHTVTVALKSAVLAMREAPAGSSFDNPWSADYICDAFWQRLSRAVARRRPLASYETFRKTISRKGTCNSFQVCKRSGQGNS